MKQVQKYVNIIIVLDIPVILNNTESNAITS